MKAPLRARELLLRQLVGQVDNLILQGSINPSVQLSGNSSLLFSYIEIAVCIDVL
jgi:hypothetical protein